MARNRSPRDTVAGFMILFGIVTLITAVSLAVQAVTETRRRHDILTNWPTTNATIRRCDLRVHTPTIRRGDSYAYWVDCDVAYPVGGHDVTSQVSSSSIAAGRDGGVYTLHDWSLVIRYPQQELRAWMQRHPPGSWLEIRYDPGAPAKATFLGGDPLVDFDKVPGSLQGAALFGMITVGFWGFRALLLRGRS